MTTIVTRAGKGSPLTNNEVDANAVNLKATADAALAKAGGAMSGAITTNSTFDGRDVATDGTKLDGVEASADVTDATNVTAAGALMDSELTSIASVKALNQGVATGDSPTFAAVTANGGVVVDNFTLDGTTLALSSGDMLVDVAGNITLDADGGNVNFNDGGANIGTIYNNSNNFAIYSAVSNADMKFQGNNGGNITTALTLDMSAAGAASFNSTIAATGATIAGTTNDGSTLTQITQSGTGRGLAVNRNVASGTRAMVNLAQLHASGGAEAVLDIQQTTTASRAIKVTPDGSIDRFSVYGTGALVTTPVAGGHAVFNEGGIDADFTVKSDGNANMLFVDGGNNLVGVGTSNPVEQFAVGAAGRRIEIGGSAGVIRGFNRTASWAGINFEASDYTFDCSTVRMLDIEASGVIFNDTGANADFKVESDGNANMLFVDGENNRVGIGTGSPGATLQIQTSHAVTDVTSANTNSTLNIANSGAGNGVYNAIKFAANQQDMYIISFNNGAQASRRIGFFVGSVAGDAVADERLSINGDGSLSTPTLGTENTRFGNQAGIALASGALYNTFFGESAGKLVNTGDENTAVGRLALATATTAQWNTAVGTGAGFGITTGNHNVAIGVNALVANTDGQNNIGLGSFAGDANTTADNMTAVGYRALTTYNRTDGANSNNTAVGAGAFLALTTGNANTAVGSEAGANQQGAANCTFLGYRAGKDSTGESNTFVGSLCGDATDDGTSNTAVGYSALSANCGDSNVAVGLNALLTCTNTNNTAVGTAAGDNVVGGTQNTLIGAQVEAEAAGSNNCIALGFNLVAGAGFTTVGIDANDIRAEHGTATWATVSDQRYKKDIVDSTAGLSFINALQPRTFKYKTLGELPETFRAYEADSTEVFKNSDTNHGFIAQEIKAAIDADSSIADGFKLWNDRDDGSQEVAEAALIPVLTKAIQELSAQVEALTARIETLEG